MPPSVSADPRSHKRSRYFFGLRLKSVRPEGGLHHFRPVIEVLRKAYARLLTSQLGAAEKARQAPEHELAAIYAAKFWRIMSAYWRAREAINRRYQSFRQWWPLLRQTRSHRR